MGLAAGLCGGRLRRLSSLQGAASDAAAAAAHRKGDRQSRRVSSIVATPAWSGNLPVYLTGLGSVTAYNTVTVKARVDGLLTSIDFKEGQLVHQGDVLATIDPRPYQVRSIRPLAILQKMKQR